MRKWRCILFSFIICMNLFIMNGCNHNNNTSGKEENKEIEIVNNVKNDQKKSERYDTYNIVGIAQLSLKGKYSYRILPLL